MNCISFRAKSSYARFRKAYTTTSTLTYLLMPPTAARGLIGAILGVDRVDLYNVTKKLDIAIEVVNDINKDTQSFNLSIMNNESSNSFSYPSNIEFLRDVEYIIYVKSDDLSLLSKIKDVLISGEYFYTPYLGASEHVCKLSFEQEFDAEKLSLGVYSVSSAFDKTEAFEMEFDNIKLYSDNIPTKISEHREYIEYKRVMFPVNSKSVKLKSDKLYKVGEKNIEFL